MYFGQVDLITGLWLRLANSNLLQLLIEMVIINHEKVQAASILHTDNEVSRTGAG